MSMDNFTKFPNEILEGLYQRKLSPLHFQIMLYVVRKTNGFQKPSDVIAVTKIAKDIGRHREQVSKAIRDLSFMGMLKVERGGRSGHEMSVLSVKDWEETVTTTSHVSKTSHVTKTSQEACQKRHANRDENVTHKRNYTKETIQKKNPLNPPYEDEEEIDRSDYTEEEIEQLRKEGWII